ncbi:MAG: Holliday junction ATP-dependent DNA helicase RuvA [Holosporales bacterium]
MITKLTGILDQKDNSSVVLDVNGVGYLVHISKKTYQALPPTGDQLILWIEHIIRQDDQVLYGFSHTLEREWFRVLMTVQGVGAKVALSILSAFSFDDLADHIIRQNSKPLTAADGVGPKVASRITLELKGKIPYDHGYTAPITNQVVASSASNDALLALCQLGYNKNEATSAIQHVLAAHKDASTSDLIRLSLQRMSLSR